MRTGAGGGIVHFSCSRIRAERQLSTRLRGCPDETTNLAARVLPVAIQELQQFHPCRARRPQSEMISCFKNKTRCQEIPRHLPRLRWRPGHLIKVRFFGRGRQIDSRYSPTAPTRTVEFAAPRTPEFLPMPAGFGVQRRRVRQKSSSDIGQLHPLEWRSKSSSPSCFPTV